MKTNTPYTTKQLKRLLSKKKDWVICVYNAGHRNSYSVLITKWIMDDMFDWFDIVDKWCTDLPIEERRSYIDNFLYNINNRSYLPVFKSPDQFRWAYMSHELSAYVYPPLEI